MTTSPPPGPWDSPPSGDAPQGYGPPPGYRPPPGYGPPAAGYGPPPGYGYGPPQGEDTTWAVLAHLSGYVLPLVGPLAIYLIKRDESPFTGHHAAEALNFHICLSIYAVVSVVLMLVVVGFFLFAAVAIAGLVLPVIAALAASRREAYRYPLTIHFLS